MRSTIRSLLVISVITCAVAGCLGEAALPAGLQATEQPLQEKGVYYVRTAGTAENPMFGFYDRNKAAVGAGWATQNPPLTEIQWQGKNWEGTGGSFSKDGVVVGSDGPDAVELDTVLTVFELSLDQAFSFDSSSLNDQVQPNACFAICQRPNNRCRGGCTGFVCSAKDGSVGICELPPL